VEDSLKPDCPLYRTGTKKLYVRNKTCYTMPDQQSVVFLKKGWCPKIVGAFGNTP